MARGSKRGWGAEGGHLGRADGPGKDRREGDSMCVGERDGPRGGALVWWVERVGLGKINGDRTPNPIRPRSRPIGPNIQASVIRSVLVAKHRILVRIFGLVSQVPIEPNIKSLTNSAQNSKV